MPDRTQEIKNLRAVAVASKNYIDKRIDDLQWQLGTYDLDVDSDTTSAYQKNVPANSIKVKTNTLGGMSYKVNQMNNLTNNTYTENGITFTITDYIMFISGTASANASWYNYNPVIRALAGKKVLVVFNSKTGVSFTGVGTSSAIITVASGNNYGFEVASGTDLTTPYTSYLNVFDLTADFGAGNEPSTVSDCATAYLQRGINIYEYTPQQSDIRDTAPTSVNSVGSNMIDITQVTDEAFITSATGQLMQGFSGVCATDYIEVVSGTNVYFGGMITLNSGNTGAMYDSSKNYVGAITSDTDIQPLTIPSNVKYIRLSIWKSNYTDYTKATLNIGSSALPYKPYFTASLLIDSHIQALDGYGWGVNDTCYNYVDFNAKKFIKKVARVDLGSIDYTRIQDGDVYYFASVLNNAKLNGNGIISKYSFILYTQNDIANILTSDKTFTITGQYYSEIPRVAIRDDSYSTAEAFKTAMSGVYLYYELATPVETDISAYLTTNKITVEGGGTLTAENTYGASVPSDIDYLIEEVKA